MTFSLLPSDDVIEVRDWVHQFATEVFLVEVALVVFLLIEDVGVVNGDIHDEYDDVNVIASKMVSPVTRAILASGKAIFSLRWTKTSSDPSQSRARSSASETVSNHPANTTATAPLPRSTGPASWPQ